MPIACWIPKATNTESECVIFFAFQLQQWLHERASSLSYTCIAFFIALFQTVWCSGKVLDLNLKVPSLNPDQIIDYPF